MSAPHLQTGSKRAGAAAGTPPATAEAPRKTWRAKLLVVDNLPSKRYLVRSILEPSHYEVLEAGSVDEALGLARQTQPGLIISDLHMPQKSGFDLVRELRADPQISHIPVLVHTASSTDQDEHKKLERSGKCSFLHSPIDPPRLLDQVENILNIKGDY